MEGGQLRLRGALRKQAASHLSLNAPPGKRVRGTLWTPTFTCLAVAACSGLGSPVLCQYMCPYVPLST